MTNRTHVSEMLPAYALDCLDQDEMILVSEHLASCASCRVELDSFQAVVDRFPLVVPEATPPTALKRKLSAQIRPAPSPTSAAQTRSRLERLTNLWKRAAPAWGAVAIILIVALGLANMVLRQQIDDAVAEKSGMRIVTLFATDSALDATGNIVISEDGEYGTLVVDGLPEIDDAHTYQLWLIRDGRPTNGGAFLVSDGGYGSLEISSHEPLSAFPEFGITVEPAGGSLGPTGDKVLGSSH